MQSKLQIKDLSIKRFRKYKSFDIQDFGHINLFAGKNNAGKSTLLEALVLVTRKNLEQAINVMLGAIYKRYVGYLHVEERYKIKSMPFFLNDASTSEASFEFDFSSMDGEKFNYRYGTIESNKITIEQRQILQRKLSFNSGEPVELIEMKINGKTTGVHAQYETTFNRVNSVDVNDDYLPLIRSTDLYALDMVHYFTTLIQGDPELRRSFVEGLKGIVSEDIVDVEISTERLGAPILMLKGADYRLRSLADYGEGTNRFARILLEIVFNRNGILCIDEIDSGIHYSQLRKYLKQIIAQCMQHNVQLFSTTHNLECLQSFAAVMEELNDEARKAARYFLIRTDSHNEIIAKKFDFAQFESAINLDNEVRG